MNALNPSVKKNQLVFSITGSLFIIAAFIIPLFFYGPLIRVEITYRIRKLFFQPLQNVSDPYATVVSKVPSVDFSLFIPKIDAVGKVYPNISTINREEYFEALKTGIAHARGTVLPGTIGNIFLFAHSTDSPLNIARYNAVFYLLRELEQNDEVFVVYQGKPYRYVVTDKKIVEPTDVTYLTAENSDHVEQVILQTCYPPGTLNKRLLIFARRTNNEHAFKIPDPMQ